MGNCLWEKLKGSVDNPNLPVLEEMQQFTLDVIDAINNSSMTDEQMWALNHFFIRLDAPTNTGIYNKLSTMVLPMLADSIDGAKYNIKTATSITLNSASTFDSGFIKGTTSSAVNNVITPKVDVPNMSAVFVTLSSGGKFVVTTQSGSDTYYELNAQFNMSLLPQQDYSNSLTVPDAYLYSIKALSINGLTSNDVFSFGANRATPVELPVTLQSDFRATNANDFYVKTSTSQGFSCLILGSGLTKTELQALTDAVKDLRNAFVEE